MKKAQLNAYAPSPRLGKAGESGIPFLKSSLITNREIPLLPPYPSSGRHEAPGEVRSLGLLLQPFCIRIFYASFAYFAVPTLPVFRVSSALRRQDRRFNRASPGGEVGENLREVFKRSGFLYELSSGNLSGRDEVQGSANRLRRVMKSAFQR